MVKFFQIHLFVFMQNTAKHGGRVTAMHIQKDRLKDRQIYRVVQKKLPILFFIPKLCFTIFCHIFQVLWTVGLGDSFDTNMDPAGRYTTQQQMKIIEVYFATKSVLLTQCQCRRDLGRNNIPDRRPIQSLVAKCRKTGNMADARKGQHHSSFAIIPENIQNLQERLMESLKNSTHHLSQEILISRASVLRILHDNVKLFSYKIQILWRQTDQNKAEGETFCEDIQKGLKMTLACWT